MALRPGAEFGLAGLHRSMPGAGCTGSLDASLALNGSVRGCRMKVVDERVLGRTPGVPSRAFILAGMDGQPGIGLATLEEESTDGLVPNRAWTGVQRHIHPSHLVR